MTRKTHFLLGGALAALASAATAQSDSASQAPVEQGAKNVPGFEPAFENQTRAPAIDSKTYVDLTTVAGGLEHPWGIATLPGDAGYLVTERPGRLRHVTPDGTVSDPIAGLPPVLNEEQGGLLDIALGPDFGETRHVYWTYAKPMGDGKSATAAARGTLSEDLAKVTDAEDIFVQTPSSPSPMHYGSRIVFDGNGHVFVTTGEHFTQAERDLAQDLDNTYGKVVRITLDGGIPDDNPFVDGDDETLDSIWSYGHRNIQGAVWHDGALWTIEHGPQGGDELNHAEAGLNYGWPVVSYGAQYSGQPVGSGEPRAEGMVEPIYYWDPVIAPAGAALYQGDAFREWQGDLLISSLVPGGIVRLELEDGRVTGEERLLENLGRVRDLELLDDGTLLTITDKADGELLRITPQTVAN